MNYGLGAARALFLLLFPWPVFSSVLACQIIFHGDDYVPFWPAPILLVAMLILTYYSQRYFARKFAGNLELKISRLILLVCGLLAGPAMEVFLYQ